MSNQNCPKNVGLIKPSCLGPTNLPPLEALLYGCPVAVTKNGNANLGNLPGAFILEGNDVETWAELLGLVTIFPVMPVIEIGSCLEEVRTTNIDQIRQIFDELRIVKGTYTL